MEKIRLSQKHYIPILRWKQGERCALRKLYSSHKADITPLIELIEKHNLVIKNKQINIPATVEKFTNELHDNWGMTNVFLDLRHLSANLRSLLIDNIFENSSVLNLKIIPVTTLDKDSNFYKTIKNLNKLYKTGICLRINYSEILNPSFKLEIDQSLKQLNLAQNEIDIIIDYGKIDNDPSIASNIFSRIPYIKSWRTFAFASGVFPQYLSELFSIGRHELMREDWIYWLDNFYTNNSNRVPIFSDYTIQHPLYVEPPQLNNPGANIRYTSENYWVIMKGEGVQNKNGKKYAQFPANALLLKESPEFCGESFSYGDDFIFKKAGNINKGKPGSLTDWIGAGINHHITFVVNQLSNLTGP